MSDDEIKKCSIEGCGKKTFWDEGLYCDTHESAYDHEYGVCRQGGCGRWYKAPAIYCALHGGTDYTPRTKEESATTATEKKEECDVWHYCGRCAPEAAPYEGGSQEKSATPKAEQCDDGKKENDSERYISIDDELRAAGIPPMIYVGGSDQAEWQRMVLARLEERAKVAK